MRKLITCPERGSLCEIEYHERPSDGHILGIVRCSLCEPADNIDCDQICSHRLNRRFGAKGQNRGSDRRRADRRDSGGSVDRSP